MLEEAAEHYRVQRLHRVIGYVVTFDGLFPVFARGWHGQINFDEKRCIALDIDTCVWSA